MALNIDKTVGKVKVDATSTGPSHSDIDKSIGGGIQFGPTGGGGRVISGGGAPAQRKLPVLKDQKGKYVRDVAGGGRKIYEKDNPTAYRLLSGERAHVGGTPVFAAATGPHTPLGHLIDWSSQPAYLVGSAIQGDPVGVLKHSAKFFAPPLMAVPQMKTKDVLPSGALRAHGWLPGGMLGAALGLPIDIIGDPLTYAGIGEVSGALKATRLLDVGLKATATKVTTGAIKAGSREHLETVGKLILQGEEARDAAKAAKPGFRLEVRAPFTRGTKTAGVDVPAGKLTQFLPSWMTHEPVGLKSLTRGEKNTSRPINQAVLRINSVGNKIKKNFSEAADLLNADIARTAEAIRVDPDEAHFQILRAVLANRDIGSIDPRLAKYVPRVKGALQQLHDSETEFFGKPLRSRKVKATTLEEAKATGEHTNVGAWFENRAHNSVDRRVREAALNMGADVHGVRKPPDDLVYKMERRIPKVAEGYVRLFRGEGPIPGPTPHGVSAAAPRTLPPPPPEGYPRGALSADERAFAEHPVPETDAERTAIVEKFPEFFPGMKGSRMSKTDRPLTRDEVARFVARRDEILSRVQRSADQRAQDSYIHGQLIARGDVPQGVLHKDLHDLATHPLPTTYEERAAYLQKFGEFFPSMRNERAGVAKKRLPEGDIESLKRVRDAMITHHQQIADEAAMKEYMAQVRRHRAGVPEGSAERGRSFHPKRKVASQHGTHLLYIDVPQEIYAAGKMADGTIILPQRLRNMARSADRRFVPNYATAKIGDETASEVMRRRGEGYPNSEAEWQQVKEEFDKVGSQMLKDVRIPPEVKKALDRVLERISQKAFGEPFGSQEQLNKMHQAMIRLTSRWKSIALTYPGFHIRNIVDDVFRAVAIGGAQNPRSYSQAAKLMKDPSRTIKIGDTYYTGYQLHELASMTGALDSGYIRREVTLGLDPSDIGKTGIRKPGEGRLSRFSRKVGQAREDWVRYGTFIERLKAGDDVLEAGRRTREAHFDYGDVGDFVQWARRYAMPFITYTAKAAPALARQAIRRPGTFSHYGSVVNALYVSQNQPDLSLLSVGQRASLPLPIPNFLKGPLGLPSGTPITLNPERLFWTGTANQLDPTQVQRQVLGGLLSPLLGYAVEGGFDYSFFLRRQYDQGTSTRPGERVFMPTGLQWAVDHGMPVPSFVQHWLNIGEKRVSYPPGSPDRLGWDPRAQTTLDLIPALTRAQSVMAPGGDTSAYPQGLLNFWLGIRLQPYDRQRYQFYASQPR